MPKLITKKEDYAMSNNRSIKKILAVALLSSMGLIACGGEVKAKPTNYNDQLITFTDNKDEIYHNLISIIDDAYRDGTLASAVLDKVLYTYSVSVFGRYNRIAEPYNLGEGEITLKEAVRSAQSDNKADADTFIEKHKAYWTTDNDGNRVETEEGKAREYARLIAKWNTIEDRISRNFYGDISGGSYSTRGYFDEKKYIASLRSQLRKVLWGDDLTTYTKEADKLVISPDVREEEVFTKKVTTKAAVETTYLHRQNYQDEVSYTIASSEKLEDAKARYVEDEIIPTIYRSLLIEQYLLDESYNSISRSAARKVNVISISTNSNNDKAADYLMKYFVRNRISGGQVTGDNEEARKAHANYIDLEDFNEVSNAYKGTPDAQYYLDLVNTDYPGAFPVKSLTYEATPYSYYVGTDYGDMMSNFAKIKDNINLTDSSVESDFTGSYTYTAGVGREIKENEIMGKSYVTDGWFIRENTIGDLPDSIKNRLVEIGVANVLDNDSTVDRFATATYTVPENESKLVAKINGAYYLKIASKQAGANEKDDILFYEGGKYYVVQIEEAVSHSKLSKESEKYAADKKEEIINEVARLIGENDTYKNLSTKHWLEQAKLKYHDTKVYDYFKENYPDLFD